MSAKNSLTAAYKIFRLPVIASRAKSFCFISCQSFETKNREEFFIKQVQGTRNCLSVRNYAKVKSGQKGKLKNIHIYENELKEYFDLEKLNADFNKPIEIFKTQLLEHATLRSSHGALENFKIKFEGSTYTIQDVAEIGKKNPKFYVLDLSAFPQMIPAISLQLQNSSFRINVQQDGNKLYVPIPKVTREQREEIVKKAKAFFVNFKSAVRDVQIKYSKKLEKTERLSEEINKRLSNQLKNVADLQIVAAEEILKAKVNELLMGE